MLPVLLAFLLSARGAAGLETAETLKDSDLRFSVAGPQAPAPSISPAQAPAAPASRVVPLRATAPDFSLTPGKLCTPQDRDFVEFRYPERVPYCKRDVPSELKSKVAALYGIPREKWPDYEFDHLIPLGIGGNSSLENLWPQPRGSAESDGKDTLEYQLYAQLKAGTITQAAAVRKIYDWFTQASPLALARAR